MAKAATPQEREERQANVAFLMLGHTEINEMARVLKVNRNTIIADVKVIRSQWKDRRLEAYEVYAAEEIAKYDALENVLWAKVSVGDTWAIDRVLAIMRQRAELLGLNAPVKKQVEVITHEQWEDEMEKLNSEIAELERLADSIAQPE